MQERFEKVTAFSADLMSKGLHVFSPITHCHPMALLADLPRDFEFWKAYCNKTLSVCDQVIVYCQEGWRQSTGVKAEIKLAKAQGKTILYTKP